MYACHVLTAVERSDLICHSQSTLLVHDVLSRSLDRNNYVWGGLAFTSHSNRNKLKRLLSSPRRLLRVRISLPSVTTPTTASPPRTLFPSPPVKPVFSADVKYRSVHVERTFYSSGAVWESKWTSWAVRPNEPSGFRGRKELLNHALAALVTTCP